jgi:GNAT superfamily N-acetyltransferase
MRAARRPVEATYEVRRGGYLVSSDPARLDLDLLHAFLSRSYWARGIPRELVARSLRHSVCFGVYEWGRQVGFARVISDRATFGYPADVFVVGSHRGRGLSTWLVQAVLAHPELQGLRRFSLVTRDAHGLHARFGFGALDAPERHMEILRPDPYAAAQE